MKLPYSVILISMVAIENQIKRRPGQVTLREHSTPKIINKG